MTPGFGTMNAQVFTTESFDTAILIDGFIEQLEGERRYVQNGERFKNGNIQKTVCQGGLWCYIGVVAIL